MAPSFSASPEAASTARARRTPAEEGPAQTGLFSKAALLPEWRRTSSSVDASVQRPLKCHQQDQPRTALYIFFCGEKRIFD